MIRLLTLALAGILVLESPATAYAAGQNMNAVVMDGAAEQYGLKALRKSGVRRSCHTAFSLASFLTILKYVDCTANIWLEIL